MTSWIKCQISLFLLIHRCWGHGDLASKRFECPVTLWNFVHKFIRCILVVSTFKESDLFLELTKIKTVCTKIAELESILIFIFSFDLSWNRKRSDVDQFQRGPSELLLEWKVKCYGYINQHLVILTCTWYRFIWLFKCCTETEWNHKSMSNI